LLHLIYMNFDNMDGKQARKTGNSSPLGLLFDHGCDSLILMLQGLSLATVLQIGNNWQSLMVYLIGCMPFFFTTLEEYYTNAMILPVINGPCEGCLVIGMFFLITGINGCNYWNEEDIIFPIARKNLLFVGFSFFSILNVSFNFYQMYTKVKENFKDSLSKMGFYAYLIGSILFVFVLSPSGISQRQARNLIYLLGLNFGKLVTHLQIAHVSGSKFIQFRRTTFMIFTTLNVNTVFGLVYGATPVNEDTLLYILLLISIFAYIHLVVNVIVQFTEVLKIKCFKVKKGIKD
jgi:ethanolaminephosphotransferase